MNIILFIDDYSRLGHLCLLIRKSYASKVQRERKSQVMRTNLDYQNTMISQ